LRFRQSPSVISVVRAIIGHMTATSSRKPELPAPLPALPEYGVYIGSHEHGPRFSLNAHQHPYSSLLYVVSGKGSCMIGKKSYPIAANSAIILRKKQQHHLIDSPSEAMVVFVVYFSEQVARRNRVALRPLLVDARPLSIPTHRAQQLRRALRQMLNEQQGRGPMFETAIQLALASIILELYRLRRETENATLTSVPPSTERVKDVLSYIAERYYEPPRLAEAAKMAHLSQRQFSSLCRLVTGKRFTEYVNTLRVERAKELLINTDMPVSAIAFEVGFEDMSTFYRAFKKYYRKPPLSFRD